MDANDSTPRSGESLPDASDSTDVAEYLLADRFAKLSDETAFLLTRAASAADESELDFDLLMELYGIQRELTQLVELTEVLVEEPEEISEARLNWEQRGNEEE